MSVLLALSRAIDAMNSLIGRTVAWLVLAAVLLSTLNAILRYQFRISANSLLEAQWYLYSAVFLLAAGYTLLTNEHVKVELIYTRLSRRAQIWVDIIGTLFFLLPFCAITLYLSFPLAVAKYVSHEVSNNPGGLIVWPAWALIPLGALLLGLQAISELIKRIAILNGAIVDPVAAADAEAAKL